MFLAESADINWLAWILGIAGTLLGVIVVDIYSHLKSSSKKAVNKRRETRIKEIQDVISTTIDTPLQEIKETQQTIVERLSVLEGATLCELRNDLVELYDRCENQGYRTKEMTETWLHMYESYKALGGNSFMARLEKDLEEIPTEQEYFKELEQQQNKK